MAFVEDLSVFFADFGASASINGGVPLAVLYDDSYVSPLGIAAAQTTVMLTVADFAAAGGAVGQPIRVDPFAAPGGPLALSALTFTIRNTEPEQGFVRLVLEQVF